VKRLLLGLLKLLLQLLIFALAGKWVKIGGAQPEPSARKQAKSSQRKSSEPRPVRRAPLFDPRAGDRRGSVATESEPLREWRSVEDGELELLEPRSIEELARAGEPRPKRGKRKRRAGSAPVERRAKPVAEPRSSAASSRPARSLAAALRDPVRIRQALILGAALGPRRPRR
jgi:hypothetical protein